MTIEHDLDFSEDDPLHEIAGGSAEGSALQVTTVAGHPLPVLNDSERTFYEKLRDDFLESYVFTDPSDISDLDRILVMELTIYRLNRQLGQGHDQHGIPLGQRDIASTNRTIKDVATTLAKAKDDLGLSKVARDASAEEDPATYLMDLRRRAAEFGIQRNKQVNQAIAELQDLISIAQTFMRSNELERSHTPFRTAEDVVAFIANEVAEKVEELDAHFRENGQKIWVGQI